MDEVDLLLQRLESEWESIVSEVNSYLSEGGFAAEKLAAIYQRHLEVIRGWGRRECGKFDFASAEALAAIRRPVVSLIVWSLWMSSETTADLKRSLLGGLWMRCEEEIRFHAKSVANLSQLSANLEERADDLLQSFYEKFVSILPMYSPEISRLTTYFKRPARNFFINCLKAEEVERRNGTKLRKVMEEESHDHKPHSWFSADDPEKQDWIVKAIEKLLSTNELTERQINVFRLRVIEGKRIVDVAAECGCSNGFVSENARLVETKLRELAAKQISEGGYYV